MSVLEEFLELIQESSIDHIMVNKDLFLAVAAALGEEQLRRIIGAESGLAARNFGGMTPEDKWFRAKMAMICRAHGVTQSALARESGVDQGDISKFLAGIKSFGPQRREKIIAALDRIGRRAGASSATRAPGQ